MSELPKLITAVREARKPCRDIDRRIWRYLGGNGDAPFFTDDPRVPPRLLLPAGTMFLVARAGELFSAEAHLTIDGERRVVSALHSHRFLAACLTALLACVLAAPQPPKMNYH